MESMPMSARVKPDLVTKEITISRTSSATECNVWPWLLGDKNHSGWTNRVEDPFHGLIGRVGHRKRRDTYGI